MKWVGIIFSILVVSVALVFSAAAESIEMPEGFETIHLDMLLSDFLKVKPNVKPFSLFIDEKETKIDVNRSEQMLSEEIKTHALFTNAMYYFKNSKLGAIILFGERDMHNFHNMQLDFIKISLKKWGFDFQKKIEEITDGKTKYLAPLLVWSKGQTKIVLTCTPDDNANLKKGAIAIHIFLPDQIDYLSKIKEVKNLQGINKLYSKIGIFTVKSNTVNIKDSNDDKSKTIDKVKKGDTVVLTESNNNWLKIILPSGKEGWISKENVEE